MIELWLFFAVGTILCYATAQQFSKKGVLILGSYQTGILYTSASVIIQTTYWLLLPDNVQGDLLGYLTAVIAGVIGALGFVFYIFALRIGKVSVVSVMTAGYPVISIILALLFLSESLTLIQGFAIMMVIGAMILLSAPESSEGNRKEGTNRMKRWLFWAIMSMIFWGLWAIPSKIAIEAIGEADYIFIDGLTMVLVWVPLWLWFEKGKLMRGFHNLKYSGFAGVMASIGTICLFLAISNGNVSIVTPVTSIYPLMTVVLARFTLKEKLVRWQYLAVLIGVSGIALLAM